MQRPVALALRGRVLTPLSEGGVELIEDGVIGVADDGRIAWVHPWRKARKLVNRPVRDMRPCVLLPGFVDAHLHFPQTEIIGRATGPLLEWLEESVFPEEARFEKRSHARRVAEVFTRRMIGAGTTTAGVFSSSSAKATQILFRHLADCGMRAVVGLTLMDARSPRELKVARAEAMKQSARLASKWHGHDGDRLKFAVTPRFALSCSKAMLRDAGRLAVDRALPVQTHIGETQREGEETLRAHPYATSYLDVYDRAELIHDRTILAHAIHMTRSEWKLIAKRGAHVAHCPDSNFFLGSGRMRVARAQRHGVNVALGTDVAAGRTFSIRRVMASAYDTAMCVGEPLSLADLLTMATLNGARALGYGDSVGSLESGKDADIIAIACNPKSRGLDALMQEIVFDTDDATVVEAYVRGRRLNPSAREANP